MGLGGRQYAIIDPTKGGKRAAVVLAFAMICSAALLGASVFLGIKLAQQAGKDAPPPAPLPQPPPDYTVNVTSDIQMALLFLQAQKSGALPANFSITYRNDSGLMDGQDMNRNLSGGFYDGGGAIKYTFPMAFSVTMLAWSVIEYETQYENAGQLVEAISLIQWGVDYLLKAKYKNIIFAQVGIPEIDDTCWMRPENMPPELRPTAFPCEPTHPCSDLAGEMAAALAAASIIFRQPNGNPVYADYIVGVAADLWGFANTYRGKYSDWVETAQQDYNSTGYTDELFWGAAWLYYATGEEGYLDYLLVSENANSYLQHSYTAGDPYLFNWDQKSPGVQVLLTRLVTMGYGIAQTDNATSPAAALNGFYLNEAKLFICKFPAENARVANFTKSGGLSWEGPTDVPLNRSIENTINTAFLTMLMVDYLTPAYTTQNINPATVYGDCNANLVDFNNFVESQKRYILGQNPLKMSYMVGWVAYGTQYPSNVYHKGASISSYQVDKKNYTCITGNQWLQSPAGNPNLLLGAVVGGPDRNDSFSNDRQNRAQSEPKTHINAVWAGLLAGTAAPDVRPGISDYSRMWVKLPLARKTARQIQALLPAVVAGTPPPPLAKR
eukprot:TRINITY_DN7385_c0_g1_i1.p1 TRINITY_DN7385_c0_g1~~TRINITY_DN7385_c0_g1_i1.p1  ORF type:complete len:610 (-),score=113.66 TRINITY_DN7385_c0_g1_i1:766-2595(-)